ncbi:unnamed protein product [Anisakis simplex]|uniref:Protein kinase domain-containing protein n=1 Tax=Anisakis simplex TaxID=6269 RepID=A0A0M3JZJ9_ANISI|nr:unnamed protein product [Anisakis simplex]
MERCYGGSLLNHLEKFGDDITIAARNCLISRFGVIKISDFGLSKVVTELAGEKLENQQIPLRWMAPETLKRDPEYSIKSDVWAYGMLLFEIYNNGGKPWPEWEPKRIATHIRRGRMIELPDRTPQSVKELVRECWKMSVAERCDFKYIVRKMTAVHLKYPAPRPENSTIARIPRVTALSMQELEVLQEQEDSEDEALGDVSIVADEERKQEDPEREATIEEVAVKRKPRKKRKRSDAGRRKRDKKGRKNNTNAIATTISSEDTDKTKPTIEDIDEAGKKVLALAQAFSEHDDISSVIFHFCHWLPHYYK